MRKFISVQDPAPGLESALLAFAARHETACVLKSNRNAFPTADKYSRFEWCVAIDAISEIIPDADAFDALKKFHDEKKDWLFGYFTYDLKNEIEKLESLHPDRLHFPQLHFFQPRYVFIKDGHGLQAGYLDEIDSDKSVLDLLHEIESEEIQYAESPELEVKPGVSRENYLHTVAEIGRAHV